MTEIRRYSIGARGEKVFHEDGPHVSYADMQEVLEHIDLLAEAGLCQRTHDGARCFLRDIRRDVAEQDIQGGLTPYGS